MQLINREINLILKWSSNCAITNSTGAGTFAIIDTNLYVPGVTLTTQDNARLLQQLRSGFTRTINWNKYQSNSMKYDRNPYLDRLVDPSFQGVNRIFALSFENDSDTATHTGYYFPKVEIKDYNFENVFDQSISNDIKTCENIQKVGTCKGDDYTTGCLLDYPSFKENYELIAIDLSKQQALDVEPRAIQQINFSRNLDCVEGTFMFFITEEAKETVLDFSQVTVKIL